MQSASQSLRILIVAAVLCGLWSVVRIQLPKPELAETNYTANRMRIERFLEGPKPKCLIVGTSIAGRLLPSYFKGSGLENIVNLSLDGASPITGLQLTLGQPKTPDLVLLEAHRLWNPVRANDHQLLALSQGMDRRLHSEVTLTKADSRPTTVLYGWLKSHQHQEGGQVTEAKGPVNASGVLKTVPRPEELIRAVHELEARGTKVVMIRLPVGRENPVDPKGQDDVDLLVKDLGLPTIDLYRQSLEWAEPIRYSDGLHLAPESARRLACALALQAKR